MAEIVKVNGVPFDFGGRVLVIPPMTLGAFEQLQKRLAGMSGDARDASGIETTIDSVHAALRRNYPDITREEVGELIDFGNMTEAMACAMDVSGLKRMSLEEKTEGKKPGE